jgi:hypothetical protein
MWGKVMVTDFKQMAGAVPILLDWLGEGMKAVPMSDAVTRARICLNCTQNTAPNWWQKNLSNPIAKVISSQLEYQKGTTSRLPKEFEYDLNMCRICGCCVRLKVWTPIQHIADHTTPEQLEKYPAFCWIKKEQE